MVTVHQEYHSNIEKYYLYSPYTTKLNSSIRMIKKNESETSLFLDRTLFRPAGGGQDPDQGFIVFKKKKIKIQKLEQTSDGIRHVIDDSTVDFHKKDKICCHLDFPRRESLMRSHTGEHILARSIQEIAGVEPLRVHIHPDEGDIVYPGAPLTWDVLLKAESKTNQLIASKIPIGSFLYDDIQEVSKKYGNRLRINLKTKVDLIRIIEIGDFDVAACTGTHLFNTADIGQLKVTNLRQSGKESIVYFKTNHKVHESIIPVFNDLWPVSQELSTGFSQLGDRIRKIQSESQNNYESVKTIESVVIPLISHQLASGLRSRKDCLIGYYEVPFGDIRFGFRILDKAQKNLEGNKSKWLLGLTVGIEPKYLLVKANLPNWDNIKPQIEGTRGKQGKNFVIIPLIQGKNGKVSFKEIEKLL